MGAAVRRGAVDGVSDHGYAAYSHGCRCDTCRTAKADYMRAKRAQAKHVGLVRLNLRKVGEYPRPTVAGVTHGTAHAYKDNGCRCLPCTEAARVKREAERQAARQATGGAA